MLSPWLDALSTPNAPSNIQTYGIGIQASPEIDPERNESTEVPNPWCISTSHVCSKAKTTVDCWLLGSL